MCKFSVKDTTHQNVVIVSDPTLSLIYHTAPAPYPRLLVPSGVASHSGGNWLSAKIGYFTGIHNSRGTLGGGEGDS
jgi:hypothetical protein